MQPHMHIGITYKLWPLTLWRCPVTAGSQVIFRKAGTGQLGASSIVHCCNSTDLCALVFLEKAEHARTVALYVVYNGENPVSASILCKPIQVSIVVQGVSECGIWP